MKEDIYKMPLEDRVEVKDTIKGVLEDEQGLSFAYVFGSFVNDIFFRDIDVGLFLEEDKFKGEEDSFDYQLDMGVKLEEGINKEIGKHFLVDVRLLNKAPFYFLNQVFSQGELLFYKDEEFLTDLIEKNSLEHVDAFPYINMYLKERLNQI